MRTAEWSDSVSVLDRVCALLDALDDDPDSSTGISELARRANLPKSTVSRLVGELAAHRILDRDDEGVYLGARMFELAQGVEAPRRLRRAALPIMSDLRDLTGLSVVLALPYGADALVVAVTRGPRTTVPVPREGGVLSVRTAVGRALDAGPGDVHRERGEHRREVGAAATSLAGADAVPTMALAVYGAVDDPGLDTAAAPLRAAARTLARRS